MCHGHRNRAGGRRPNIFSLTPLKRFREACHVSNSVCLSWKILSNHDKEKTRLSAKYYPAWQCLFLREGPSSAAVLTLSMKRQK